MLSNLEICSFEDMIEMDNDNAMFFQESHSLSNISKEYSNFNKAIQQHPTIAEELEAVAETQTEVDSLATDRKIKDFHLPLRCYQKSPFPENIKASEAKESVTLTKHAITKSKSDTFNSCDIVETCASNSSNNDSVFRTNSLRKRTSNITPKSPILEASKSISSQETIEADNSKVDVNKQAYRKEGKSSNSSKPTDRRDLYKRMASDTDLWMAMKSRPSKFQSNLEATKETAHEPTVAPSKSKKYKHINFILIGLSNVLLYCILGIISSFIYLI